MSSEAARHKMFTTMGDPVLLYAACALSGSAHLYELARQSMPSDSQYILQRRREANGYTERAMGSLRARLGNNEEAVLPSTIMAVAQLVMSAVSFL